MGRAPWVHVSVPGPMGRQGSPVVGWAGLGSAVAGEGVDERRAALAGTEFIGIGSYGRADGLPRSGGFACWWRCMAVALIAGNVMTMADSQPGPRPQPGHVPTTRCSTS